MNYQNQIWSKPVRSNLVVQKDEVHLYEGEGHPGGGRQRQQHVVTFGVALHLEVLSELEPRVDHAADTKRWNHTQTRYLLLHRVHVHQDLPSS